MPDTYLCKSQSNLAVSHRCWPDCGCAARNTSDKQFSTDLTTYSGGRMYMRARIGFRDTAHFAAWIIEKISQDQDLICTHDYGFATFSVRECAEIGTSAYHTKVQAWAEEMLGKQNWWGPKKDTQNA